MTNGSASGFDPLQRHQEDSTIRASWAQHHADSSFKTLICWRRSDAFPRTLVSVWATPQGRREQLPLVEGRLTTPTIIIICFLEWIVFNSYLSRAAARFAREGGHPSDTDASPFTGERGLANTQGTSQSQLSRPMPPRDFTSMESRRRRKLLGLEHGQLWLSNQEVTIPPCNTKQYQTKQIQNNASSRLHPAQHSVNY